MNNMTALENILFRCEEIRDHLNRPAITARIYASLAWSAGARIVQTLQFMHECNKTLADMDERYEDDDDARREAQENTIKALGDAERQLEELKNFFSYASAHTEAVYKGGSDSTKIVALVSTFDDDVRPDDVIDMEDLKLDVERGEVTQAQANQFIADSVAQQIEQNQEREKWLRAQKDYLISELDAAKRVHPGEFEISDKLLAAFMEKIGDKLDITINDYKLLQRRRNIAPRRKDAMRANIPLLRSLLDTVNEQTIDLLHKMEGSGYDVEENGVH